MSDAVQSLRVASLFSGIGGFEAGLAEAGHDVIMFCESDPAAQAVLRHRFPGVPIESDVEVLSSLPECDLVTAGWPCQDISLAGSLKGMEGSKSVLVKELFRLLRKSTKRPEFLLLENVAFALDLRRGEIVRYVLSSLEELGYRWAYRVLDSRNFGLPQRRRRLFIVASQNHEPAQILFPAATAEQVGVDDPSMVGFYWTEGNRGVGWTPEAVPPLKGGSGLSIPSPPAIWDRQFGFFFTPVIADAERMQGFQADWTIAANANAMDRGRRWRLVGNAVSVPIAKWLGQRLNRAVSTNNTNLPMSPPPFRRTPLAAFGAPRRDWTPVQTPFEGGSQIERVFLRDFQINREQPLSMRAASGFTRRYEVAPLRLNQEFLQALKHYVGLPGLA